MQTLRSEIFITESSKALKSEALHGSTLHEHMHFHLHELHRDVCRLKHGGPKRDPNRCAVPCMLTRMQAIDGQAATLSTSLDPESETGLR